MFKKVRTLAVYVTDMTRARQFYTEVLGFRVRADVHPGLCFLESQNGSIDIYLEAGMKPAVVDNGMARLSFFLETDSTAADTFARLKAAGVTLLQQAPEEVGDGIFCFQFLDPDGNVLEACGRP
jgi:catechol 2,3-dioxygenase-like lactoylglutathione lyase family enzyme